MDNRMQQQGIAEMYKTLIGKKFRHFKGGEYMITGVGVHSETAEVMFVYSDRNGNTWIRPAFMFLSPVDTEKYPDARQRMRFELIEEGEG